MMMVALPQLAWITREYVNGRTQRDIAEDLGVAPAVISTRVKRFCEYHGYEVSRLMMYGLERQEAASCALAKYQGYGGELVRPTTRPWGDETPFTVSELASARGEHAWLLRAEGLKLREIGARLGVCRERAKQIVDKHGRKVTRAMRYLRWPTSEEEHAD
jgi:hypothetical protein